ncbi:hypothetical protein IE53DRAFT_384534 [Violaceomyces palustris]|uniref:Uncharacterized protein n=1 Tax=Violaceomyces palustris TaxID=1673888 RepID=A0ACD0P4R5_9BASI|nr:hypothetical protein IE53DRAFT_384534 [Violaceomyces palustris]
MPLHRHLFNLFLVHSFVCHVLAQSVTGDLVHLALGRGPWLLNRAEGEILDHYGFRWESREKITQREVTKRIWYVSEGAERRLRTISPDFNCHDYMTGGIAYLERSGFDARVVEELKEKKTQYERHLIQLHMDTLFNLDQMIERYGGHLSEDFQDKLREPFADDPFIPRLRF